MPNLLTPNGVNHEQLKSRDERAKVSQKRYFDQHTHLQPNLHPGDPVLFKHDVKLAASELYGIRKELSMVRRVGSNNGHPG